VTAPDTPDATLLLRRQAVQEGWTDDELARLARAGEVSRLRRGAYVDGPLPQSVATRHRLLVRATLSGFRRWSVVSHQSAAVLLGLPLWGVGLDRVHVTRRPPAWSDRSAVLRVHVARLQEDEIVEVDGVPVTSPVRTALDLARSLPFETAVVVLDAALRRGTVQPELVRERLFDIAGTPGSRSAARAVRFADGRSESVGESRSRVLLHALGLPPSAVQFPVIGADGSFLARTDFAWEDRRVVGEFDGRVKYGRLLRPGQEAGDVVFEEKRREDAIRNEGWGAVRWVWSDLGRRDRLADRVRRALGRGARDR
jgi:hypothetical protein